METYIVRIYRDYERSPDGFLGSVERVGVNGQLSFRSFKELRAILSRTNGETARRPVSAERPR